MSARSRGSPATASEPLGSAPLAGCTVFLHIRAGPGEARTAASVRRACWQHVRQLGGSLSLSEAGANLIVGVRASPGLLASCAAQGKAVVSPAYLRACVEAGTRLDAGAYRVVASAAGEERERGSRTPTAAEREGSGSPAARRRSKPTPTRPSRLSDTAQVQMKSPDASPAAPPQRPPVPVHAAASVQLLADESDEESGGQVERVERGSFMRATGPAPSQPHTPLISAAPEAEELSSTGSTETNVVTPPPSLEGSPAHHPGPSPQSHQDEVRHAVLRAAVQSRATVRLGSGVASSEGSRKRGRAGRLARDPFLSAEGVTATASPSPGDSALTPSPLASCAVTQPLPPCPDPSVVSTPVPAVGRRGGVARLRAATVERTAVHKGTDKETEAPAPVATPAAAVRGKRGGRALKAKTPAAEDVVDRTAASVSICFTESEELRRTEAHPAGDFHIAVHVRDPAQAAFLEDVVEQLGAHCVPADSVFGRHRKPTHLVVDDLHTEGGGAVAANCTDERVGLTPAILLAKALGIRILRPQWLYDAIAVGGLPEVLPHMHAHPIFGLEQDLPPACDGGECSAEGAVTAAAAAAAYVREAWERETTEEVLGVVQTPPPTPAEGDVLAGRGPDSSARSGTTRATLAFLAKTTHDEVLPPSMVWERPYHRPVFTGMDFFLEIGSHAGGAGHRRKSADTRRQRRMPQQQQQQHSHEPSPTSPHTLLSSDEAEAFEQATELIRALGGTVTRTRASPHLDIVLDLYGFCAPVHATTEGSRGARPQAEAGGTGCASGPHSRKRGRWGDTTPTTTTTPPSSLVVMESMSSLSHAYQEALARLETYSPPHAPPPRDERRDGPPTVGVPWLVHCVLQRTRSEVEPFLCTGAPPTPARTTALPTAAHGPSVPAAVRAGEARAGGDQTKRTGRLLPLVASPTSADAGMPSVANLLRLSMSAASPVVKTHMGPVAARKQAERQLETQEIQAALGNLEDS